MDLLPPDLKLVDGPANKISLPDGPGNILIDGDRLVVNTWKDLRIFDLTDPRRLELVSTFKPAERFTGKMRQAGDLLFLFDEKEIEAVDLSTPSAPRSAWRATVASRGRICGDAEGGLLYFTSKEGIGRVDLAGSSPPRTAFKLEPFREYESDLISRAGCLVVVCDDGLLTFQIEAPGRLKALKKVAVGYTPRDMHPLPDPARLLLVGHDNVIPVDVTAPKAPKRHKAIKLPVNGVGPAVWQQGDRLLVAGLKGEKGLVAEIDLATEKVIGRVWLPDFTPKRGSSDGMRGVAWSKGCLVVVSFTRQIMVYEAE